VAERANSAAAEWFLGRRPVQVQAFSGPRAFGEVQFQIGGASMNIKSLSFAIRMIAAALMAVGSGTMAQDPRPVHFTGVINDYSPISGGTTAWELHGPWSLALNEETGTAHFSASLTMALSVLGQASTNVAAVNLAQHTHNITMDGTVTYNPTDCPPAATTTPPYAARIEINGSASVFANGNVPPFGQFSQLQVCIAGGKDEPNVPFSNITLVFANGAATHFGSQAIHGVVSKVRNENPDAAH
jgi:hypothetical protein